MSRVCTVCTHPERHAIEKALVGGMANRRIAAQYGLSEASVRRHADGHLPVALVQAQDAQELAHALDVVAQLKTINGAALTVLRDARAASDGELALKAIDRILKQIELQAKLLGDLDERPVINVLLSPEWQQLRGRIVAALAAYPEARLSVAEALDATG